MKYNTIVERLVTEKDAAKFVRAGFNKRESQQRDDEEISSADLITLTRSA